MKKYASGLMLAASLAAAASLANAAQIEHSTNLPLTDGTSDIGTSFDATESGQSFLQSYLFSNSGSFSLSSAVISTALGSQSSLDINNFTLSGNGQTYAGTKSVVGNTQYYTISLSNLAMGNYVLAVAGTVTGAAGGSFGGNVSIAAVPEASTVAMMLGGLALVGMVATRRRRQDQDRPAAREMLPA